MTRNHHRSASRWLLSRAARLAPARLSDWADAMIAELDFIEHNADAVKWTLGCLIVIAHEAIVSLVSTALHGPAHSWNSLKEETPAMRNGRVAAASALILTAAFFLTSSLRQAVTIAAITLRGPAAAYSDISTRELDEMRSAAEQSRDARMLAFAALHDRRIKIAHRSADLAVSIDPRWTWTYYNLARRGVPEQQRAADIARLQQWDPENGFIYLVRAENLAPQVLAPAGDIKLSGSEPWVQMAARGFEAPRYNSYQREEFELERDVARERGAANPLRLAMACAGGRLPNMMLVRQYAEYALNSAVTPDELARQARLQAALGERMMACPSEVENWAGQQLALDGYRKLASVSPAPERDLISSRIARLDPPRRPTTPATSSSWSLTTALRTNALTIQASFVLILMAILAMAAASACLLARRGKGSKTISGLFWVSAGTLFAASVASYIAYQPYAWLFLQAMNPETPTDSSIHLVKAFYSYGYPTSQSLDVYCWAGLTLFLLIVLAVLLSRKLRPPARPPSAATSANWSH